MAAKYTIVCLIVLFGVTVSENADICRKLVEAGFSHNYNETIAHSIHSMTVQGLQLFNPLATEDNRVPTVNMDRKAPEKVIPYAPNDPLGSEVSDVQL